MFHVHAGLSGSELGAQHVCLWFSNASKHRDPLSLSLPFFLLSVFQGNRARVSFCFSSGLSLSDSFSLPQDGFSLCRHLLQLCGGCRVLALPAVSAGV